MADTIITIIIGVLTAVILSFGAYIYKKIKLVGTKHDAIQKGLKALLRDRIIQMYNYYSMKSCIPIYARENVESLHIEYKALGGNGTVDGLVARLMLLPTDRAYDADYESRDVIA